MMAESPGGLGFRVQGFPCLYWDNPPIMGNQKKMENGMETGIVDGEVL